MSFKDIKGQDSSLELLRRAIQEDSVAKAYLFSGPEGIGKRRAALEFAKAVNCRDNDADSCGECGCCLKIDNNRHPDVRLIEGESGTIRIDDIRQMQREINLRPYDAQLKVYIIDNAHNLNAESSNALLKTLEEPPAHSVIVLVSSKPSLLFKTVISRCQIVRFYPLGRDRLEGILKSEYGLDVSRAHFLSYFCEGRIGDALRLKDAGFYQEKNRVIDDFLTSRHSVAPAVSVSQTREGLHRDINILIGWFRDICFLKTGMAGEELINFDRRNELAMMAQDYTQEQLSGIFDFLSEAHLRIDQNVNLKLLTSNLKAELWKG
ncbi:MAG: DNA polymerase III subunit delta' [Candidatus Omnitrophota bacterium]